MTSRTTPMPHRPGTLIASWLMSRLTLERLLYGLLLLAGAGLRLANLGGRPLTPLEASQAWPAWLRAMGQSAPYPPEPISPLLFTGQRFLFWLTGGGSDAWARALPALAGLGMVPLAWWLRPWLGRTGALFLALFLALDPWLLALSRTGDSAALSLFLGLLALVALLQLGAKGGETGGTARAGSGWAALLAVALGLLLVSGPLAWSLLPVLALLAWLLGLGLPARRRLLSLLGLGGGVAFLAATGWLAHPDGLTTVSRSLGVWLGNIRGADVRYPLSWPFIRLLVDEPLALFLGLAGLVALLRSHPGDLGARSRVPLAGDLAWGRFLALWAAWGLLLLLLPGRNPTGLPVLGLPLLLAGAWLSARLLGHGLACLKKQDAQEDGILVAAALGVLLVTTAILTALFSQGALTATFSPRALALYLTLPLLIGFFAWWTGWRLTSQVLSLYLPVILVLLTVHSGWNLGLRGDRVRGTELFAQSTPRDLRFLVADVAQLSAIRARDDREIPLQVQMDGRPDPVLGWHLRRMRNLSWVRVPAVTPEGPVMPLVIATDPLLSGDLLPPRAIGSDYAVRRTWLPTDFSRLSEFVRWALYREVKTPIPVESVVLWAQEE